MLEENIWMMFFGHRKIMFFLTYFLVHLPFFGAYAHALVLVLFHACKSVPYKQMNI
jgi:hypothetical protein